MIQQQIPVRRGMLLPHQYQFTDEDDNPISLVGYTSVFMEVKLQGQVYQRMPASFDQQSNGIVISSYTYTVLGIWTAQFVCYDGLGNPLWGEPIRFRVVANVEDLALSELPNY